MRRSFSLGSYANFEEYFSEEYFRASVIDGATRARDSLYRFRICFFFLLQSQTRVVYFRLEQTLAIAYFICAQAQERTPGSPLFIFFRGLFRNWIRSQSRDSRACLAKLSSDDSRTAEISRHSTRRTSRKRIKKVPCLFFFFLFLFFNRRHIVICSS